MGCGCSQRHVPAAPPVPQAPVPEASPQVVTATLQPTPPPDPAPVDPATS